MAKNQSTAQSPEGQGSEALIIPVPEKLMWTRKEAAKMCGVCVAIFSEWVRDGFMPQPLKSGRFSADAIRSRLASSAPASAVADTPYDRMKAMQ